MICRNDHQGPGVLVGKIKSLSDCLVKVLGFGDYSFNTIGVASSI